MLQEHLQQLAGLLLELDSDALFAQFPGAEICLEDAEANRSTRWMSALQQASTPKRCFVVYHRCAMMQDSYHLKPSSASG
jgi:hypothetical protein